ncbi:MAG: NAD(P)-binding protein, partial [Pirellulales bacterium]|nr:NAD(P)-binding protein [Pirellulales bacterium]
MPTYEIAVIGAGIGGLTAALCRHKAGHKVTVWEQAKQLGEVGAGIQISPNALKVYRQIGIADAVDAAGVRPASLDGLDYKTGEVITCIPLGDAFEERYGAPYYHLHRHDLHAILTEAV